MEYKVHIHSATSLDCDKKDDPYVEAMCGNYTVKTQKMKNAGSNVAFNSNLVVPVVPGEEIRFCVKEDDMMKDDIVGTGSISEMDLRDGRFEGEVQLTTKKGKDGGKLRVSVMRC